MPFPGEQIEKEWTYKGVASLSKGLNLSIRPDALADEELLTAKNIVIQKQRLQRDTGYKDFGDVVAGTPQADFEFLKTTGVQELLLVTTLSLYKFNETFDKWHYVSGGTSTLANGGEIAGATSITVDAIAGFANGDRIGIELDNGDQHKTTVNGAPAGVEIPITDAIPVGRSVPDNAVVLKAVVLAGDLDFHVVGVTLPSHDVFVFTNGIDIVKKYDGSSCVNVPNLPSAGNTIAKSLALYNNALFLINTIEGGTAKPRRVRRSDAGDYTNWTTGTAGFDDLFEDETPLIGCELLGPYLIVYGERQIIRGEFLGTGGINYRFETMVRGEGLISTLSMADVGDAHYLFCQSNLYVYRGGFDLEPVGDNVYYKIFGSQGEINPSFRNRCFCFYVEELDEVWFFYPSTSSENCDRLIRYNIGDESWVERQFSHAFVGFGFYQTQTNRPWNSLVGSWLDQTWKWNDRSVTSNSPTTHLMPATSNQVKEYDYTTGLDDGAAISYTVETKDFASLDALQRFDMLELLMRGTSVLIEYSTDEGVTWNQMGTLSRTTYGRERLFRQFAFQKVRFRFSGSSGDFQMGAIGFSHKEESVYG